MNAEVDALPDMLARLKLTAMRDRLDGLLDEAARGDLSLRETLALLCRAEVSHREERRIQMGTSIAKFPHQRTLEAFDFAAQPSLDAKQVRDLAACRWVANGDALLIQGPPGVGKTHLAIALGREAIRHGYSVLFTPATALVTTLVRGHAEGRLEQRLTAHTAITSTSTRRCSTLPEQRGSSTATRYWPSFSIDMPRSPATARARHHTSGRGRREKSHA